MKSLTRNVVNWTKSILEKNRQTKVVIGISGGKDSLTLLYALHGLKRFYPANFSEYHSEYWSKNCR